MRLQIDAEPKRIRDQHSARNVIKLNLKDATQKNDINAENVSSKSENTLQSFLFTEAPLSATRCPIEDDVDPYCLVSCPSNSYV